jgi:citrate lyase subunit beta / citryl-CoA lyase
VAKPVPSRPRRTVLYVPGSNARALAKAENLPVDCVILDLEDSVIPEAKAEARVQALGALSSGRFGTKETVVRINAVTTEWWLDDVTAAVRAKPDALLIPKVSSIGDLQIVAQRLVDVSADQSIRVWAMMETPLAMLYAREIAAAAKDAETRLTCFVMGTNDLARETRTKILPRRNAMRLWLMTCIAAARAYGLGILDGVFTDIGDSDGFARECAEARDIGFDGKTVIHPSQIDTCNAAFSLTAEDVAQAHEIIATFQKPENADKAIIMVRGRMVDRLQAEFARRTLALAEATPNRSLPAMETVI